MIVDWWLLLDQNFHITIFLWLLTNHFKKPNLKLDTNVFTTVNYLNTYTSKLLPKHSVYQMMLMKMNMLIEKCYITTCDDNQASEFMHFVNILLLCCYSMFHFLHLMGRYHVMRYDRNRKFSKKNVHIHSTHNLNTP